MIHCTATPEGRIVTKQDIEKWHIKENGWSKVGYSDMFHQDGSLENFIPFNQDNIVNSWEISNGAYGFNGVSRHIVYVGGIDKDGNHINTMTKAQTYSLTIYLRYMILRHPDILIMGHNQANKTDCPSFHVPQFCVDLGIPTREYLHVQKFIN